VVQLKQAAALRVLMWRTLVLLVVTIQAKVALRLAMQVLWVGHQETLEVQVEQ
jgi:hypothetical protein